mgnify:CR=1 FL=1
MKTKVLGLLSFLMISISANSKTEFQRIEKLLKNMFPGST